MKKTHSNNFVEDGKRRLSIVSNTLSTLPIETSLNVNRMEIFRWFLEPQVYLVAGIYMSSRLFVNVSQSYIIFFVQYTVALSEEMIAIIPLMMYIAGIVVSFGLKILTDKLGYKKGFVLSCVVGLGMFIWDAFHQSDLVL